MAGEVRHQKSHFLTNWEARVARSLPTMPRTPIFTKWSNDESATLRRLGSTSLTITAIARRMRRSHDIVRQKAAELGLPSKNHGNRGSKSAVS